MRAEIMCGLAKVKRRKIPNLLLSICIMITAALLVNALVFLKELDGIFDRAYEEMKGPQMCCLWSKEMVSCETVRQYMDHALSEPEYQITENTKTIEYIEKDGVKLSNGILSELPKAVSQGRSAELLSPKITDGTKPDMPGKDEVWITAKTANILSLKEGDEVSLQSAGASVSAKVVKIVADPVFGGSSNNVYRMWCGYGHLADFPLAGNNGVSYLEIRFREYNPQKEQRFIRETEEYFQMPLGDTLYTYAQIKGGYTSVYQMTGAVLSFVSVILAVTVIVLVVFLIKSDMDEDVRNIGIYKSLGMTGGQIIAAYLVCYGIIGGVGAAFGSALGGWLSRGIIKKILGDMGICTVSFRGIERHPFLAGFLVTAAVMAACFFSISRARRINASEAVRQGVWQMEEKGAKVQKKTCYDGRGSFEFYYAVRGIQNKKSRYLYIAGVSMIFSCLAAVCFGGLNAVENIDKEPEVWGFIRTDIYITSLEDTPVSTVIKELEKDPRVDYIYGVNKVHPKYLPENENTWKSMVAELYELPWDEKIEDRSLYGRRPQKENEIGVGLSLAEEYGLKIGKKMELFINLKTV